MERKLTNQIERQVNCFMIQNLTHAYKMIVKMQKISECPFKCIMRELLTGNNLKRADQIQYKSADNAF